MPKFHIQTVESDEQFSFWEGYESCRLQPNVVVMTRCHDSPPLLSGLQFRLREYVYVCKGKYLTGCVCVCVPGVHWLGATFWMVSQQTDIIRSTTRWRIFNLVLGAIHIFLFLNVKYGQSRCRMAGFYLVCVCVCVCVCVRVFVCVSEYLVGGPLI